MVFLPIIFMIGEFVDFSVLLEFPKYIIYLIYYIINKKKFHSIKESGLPADTKKYLRSSCYICYIDFIEDIDEQCCFINEKSYKHFKILKNYCKQNNIKCAVPLLVDEIVTNQKICDWLIKNDIYTENQLKEKKYLGKPDFSIDELLKCDYKELGKHIDPYWYIEFDKLDELTDILSCEIEKNNYNILDYQDDIWYFKFKNINDNVIKYHKLQKEFTLSCRKILYYTDNIDNEISINNNDFDFKYDLSSDYLEITLDDDIINSYFFEHYLNAILVKIYNISHVNLIKTCNDYYSEKTSRNLFLDSYDSAAETIHDILAELNRISL